MISPFCACHAHTHAGTEQTGQALILAPSALIVASEPGYDNSTALQQCGRRYMLVKTRKRITRDGGASILVVQ